jgi:serine protease inhibitor
MVLNRPFLFLIRDNATRALLFVGVVMDPTVS